MEVEAREPLTRAGQGVRIDACTLQQPEVIEESTTGERGRRERERERARREGREREDQML